MAQQLLDRIRDHMESAGLSKSGVARAAGLHPNSLRSMDSESWNPTADTLSRLEWAGYIHIRPDWDDARRKFVAISPAGRSARDAALAAFMPRITDVVRDIGAERVRAALPVLRLLRKQLEESLRQDAAGAGAGRRQGAGWRW